MQLTLSYLTLPPYTHSVSFPPFKKYFPSASIRLPIARVSIKSYIFIFEMPLVSSIGSLSPEKNLQYVLNYWIILTLSQNSYIEPHIWCFLRTGWSNWPDSFALHQASLDTRCILELHMLLLFCMLYPFCGDHTQNICICSNGPHTIGNQMRYLWNEDITKRG